MKHDLNRLKSGGGQEGAAAAARGQGRQSNQSESEQLEKAVASVRQCHSRRQNENEGTVHIPLHILSPLLCRRGLRTIVYIVSELRLYKTRRNEICASVSGVKPVDGMLFSM